MRKIDQILPRWGWFVLYTAVFGAILFSFALLCQTSTDIPSPPLALPLPRRLLAGLAFIFLMPPALIPCSILLATSRMLILTLKRLQSTSVVLVAVGGVLVGALWVPNPIILWPFSILGDHPIPELIDRFFAFHIVPAPQGMLSSTTFDSLFAWQLAETGIRFAILMIGWISVLATIWGINRTQMTANKSVDPYFSPSADAV